MTQVWKITIGVDHKSHPAHILFSTKDEADKCIGKITWTNSYYSVSKTEWRANMNHSWYIKLTKETLYDKAENVDYNFV